MCLALLFSGVANAATADEKCVNNVNKGAAKVAKAQGKENSSCIKNAGKGKLTTTIEACLTADLKNKVSDTIGKIKTGDCGGSAPAVLPDLLGCPPGSPSR
jgi:hypothetical protein